jgi:hypothetical protein
MAVVLAATLVAVMAVAVLNRFAAAPALADLFLVFEDFLAGFFFTAPTSSASMSNSMASFSLSPPSSS